MHSHRRICTFDECLSAASARVNGNLVSSQPCRFWCYTIVICLIASILCAQMGDGFRLAELLSGSSSGGVVENYGWEAKHFCQIKNAPSKPHKCVFQVRWMIT